MWHYLSCCLFINFWWGDVLSFSLSFYSHMWSGGTISYFLVSRSKLSIWSYTLLVGVLMFLEVLSLQVFFTVCFLKFILSCILHLGQNELHNASTPWGLLPSHHIASSMNIVKVRDIPEKVDSRIRTGVNFFNVWLKWFVFVWLKRFIFRDGSMGTGAWETGAWGNRTWGTGACE